MNTALPDTADDLIRYILERFHDTHRREVPEIVRLGRELVGRGAPDWLPDELEAMGQALEDHMFKEEMRLFPMMEQGGGSMIVHLIEDMNAEHTSHKQEMARMNALLDELPPALRVEPGYEGLRAAVAKLFADLADHIHAEDDVLFPMFISPGGVARPIP